MALIDFTGSPHGGLHKLLPEWNSQPQIRPVGLVKHTIVGSAAGAFAYFRDLTGVESTFILPKTGQIWQLMDTERTADAQVAGNRWVVAGVAYGYLSVETEDNGDPEHDPWTAQQLDSLRWLEDKLARVHGWPRKQTTRPSGITVPDGGSGYHSMWGVNSRTAQPNPWTTANGKTCPAGPRIAQYKTTLLPAYIGGSKPQEDDMSAADVEAIKRDVHDTVLRAVKVALDGSPNAEYPASDLKGWDGLSLKARMTELGTRLDSVDATLAEIKAAVTTPPTPPTPTSGA